MPPGLQPVSWQRMIRAVEKVRQRMQRSAESIDQTNVPYAIVSDQAEYVRTCPVTVLISNYKTGRRNGRAKPAGRRLVAFVNDH